ncbi:MAG: redox-sensing transcriptional repressor Rex [Clostridia bacterium]|nr:redox-sensing transcriptional repressor Rex [Clostridia bacterium]
MTNRRIPEAVIRRLPKYYTKLCELEAEGITKISSMQLSKKMDLNASQIRQDLNSLGNFGQQGYGYMVDSLKENLAQILGLFQNRTMVVVGSGNIGAALAHYSDFETNGFKIVRMFEKEEKFVGKSIRGIKIESVDILEDFLTKHKVDIGVIAVPANAAQEIADIFTRNGIKAIWNFAPVDIVAHNVVIEDVRLNDSLFVLNYKFMNEIYDY